MITLPERVTTDVGALRVTPFPVVHGNSGGPFYGYRIAVGDRVIAFSGDTEWTDTLVDIARDADLFITECYAYDKPVRYHLNFKTLAHNLPRLTAKQLILTHMSDEMLAQIDKVPHTTARDGMKVEL
jgi:ribonuclease BN (tRNA processing enzyme)